MASEFQDNPGRELVDSLKRSVINPAEDLEIQRSNPNSPLHSVKSFDELNLPDEFLQAIYTMGFNAPSKIQETALPALMENPPVNMMAQAQSGTGKTAAFLLAALSRVDRTAHYPQVLILLPTFELAEQIASECRKILRYTNGIHVLHAFRGQLLNRGSTIDQQVIIGTPGKVYDWALKLKLFDISKIHVFVLDEADQMISEDGHQGICISIHKKLNAASCQMMLFSATFNEHIIQLTNAIIRDPFIVITLKKEELSMDKISQFYMHTEGDEQKIDALQNLYQILPIGQVIIFCRTRDTASKIAIVLKELGQNVGVLHGELDVIQRAATIDSFRRGHQKVLITTNVCSRGIDITQVSLVVNYHLPQDRMGQADFETYLHRIGRTGRFGRRGTAVNFVDPRKEAEIKALQDIQEYFQKPIKYIDYNCFDDIASMRQY